MVYHAIGHGGLPVFIGGKTQRGHGIGSIFSTLARSAIPMLKSIGRKIAPSMINSGANFLSDVVSGASPKEAFKQRLKEGGGNIIQSLGQRSTSSSTKRKRNLLGVPGYGSNPPGRKPAKQRKKSNKRINDIFG